MTPTTTARMPSGPPSTARESSSFEYSIYIACPPEKLWNALTLNELLKHWWRGHTMETDWQTGSPITSRFADGSLEFKGRVTESNRPRTLRFEVEELYWTDEYAGEPSRVGFQIEGFGSLAKLTLRNEGPRKLVQLASQGWPAVLSSLKSLLETGTPLALDAVFGPERNPSKETPGLFAERKIEINAPPRRVWQALTDPALTRHWIREFSPEFTLLSSDWTRKAPVRWEDASAKAHVVGEVTAVEPPKLLHFTVRDPSGEHDFLNEPGDGISYSLTEHDRRTTLTVSHGDFGKKPEYRKYYDEVGATWDRVLPIVKRLAEEGEGQG
jgi:uncharacterized protein YndB with AHSA1/START domain